MAGVKGSKWSVVDGVWTQIKAAPIAKQSKDECEAETPLTEEEFKALIWAKCDEEVAALERAELEARWEAEVRYEHAREQMWKKVVAESPSDGNKKLMRLEFDQWYEKHFPRPR